MEDAEEEEAGDVTAAGPDGHSEGCNKQSQQKVGVCVDFILVPSQFILTPHFLQTA